MKKVKESDYYLDVKKWLEKSHLCFKTAINKGLKKYSIIDVIGVTDVGGDLSGEVEMIAVEVKKGAEPFAKASGQALANKVYANRIYLADVRDNQFSPDEIQIASHLGIGLIQIQNQDCKEVLSSPYHKPIEKLNLMLLENLALGKCQLCGSFFEIGDIEQNKFAKLSRENFKKAMKDEKGLMFWNREVDERKRKVGIQQKKAGFTHESRFICPDCIYYFFSQFKVTD
jgi:hypothetical protein